MDITANGAAQQRPLPPPVDALEQKLPRTAGILQTTGRETERRGQDMRHHAQAERAPPVYPSKAQPAREIKSHG